jgi:hypothetical protein
MAPPCELAKEVLLSCILAAPDLNLSQNAKYPEIFRHLSQSLQENFEVVHQITPGPFPSTSFPIHYSLTITQCYAVCGTFTLQELTGQTFGRSFVMT